MALHALLKWPEKTYAPNTNSCALLNLGQDQRVVQSLSEPWGNVHSATRLKIVSNVAGWKIHHLCMISPAINLHLAREFPSETRLII